jgi:hypothetical protein
MSETDQGFEETNSELNLPEDNPTHSRSSISGYTLIGFSRHTLTPEESQQTIICGYECSRWQTVGSSTN